MVNKKGINYYLYDEIEPKIIQNLKDRLLNAEYKFIGDINKVRFSKKRISNELSKQGYDKIRLQVNGVRRYYYYKV